MFVSACPPEAFLADYVDGRLDPLHKGWLDEHLAQCGTCRRTVAISCTAAEIRRRTGEVELVTE